MLPSWPSANEDTVLRASPAGRTRSALPPPAANRCSPTLPRDCTVAYSHRPSRDHCGALWRLSSDAPTSCRTPLPTSTVHTCVSSEFVSEDVIGRLSPSYAMDFPSGDHTGRYSLLLVCVS